MQHAVIDAPDHEIERSYVVTLIDEIGNRCDPRRVRLRYTPGEADRLDPTSPEAFAEAAARAERLERREFVCLATTRFTADVVHQSGRTRTVKPTDRDGRLIRTRYRSPEGT